MLYIIATNRVIKSIRSELITVLYSAETKELSLPQTKPHDIYQLEYLNSKISTNNTNEHKKHHP